MNITKNLNRVSNEKVLIAEYQTTVMNAVSPQTVIKGQSSSHRRTLRNRSVLILANTSRLNQRSLCDLFVENTRSSDYNADRYTRYYAALPFTAQRINCVPGRKFR